MNKTPNQSTASDSDLSMLAGSLTIGTVRIYRDIDSIAMTDCDYGSNETLYIPIKEIPNLVNFLKRMSENERNNHD